MRVLAACSLGGAGHLQPLVPLLAAAERQGHEILVVGPPALKAQVDRTGFPFRSGGEPAEEEIAPIRELLPVAPPEEASVLGNRELFGRLAATAMLPEMERVFSEWRPDLVLRDPCEYASAVVSATLDVPMAQVAISLAEAEAGSITAAAPALEEHRRGLADELRAAPYLTRFPASLDPSPFPATTRYRESPELGAHPVPDWWNGSDAPLVYVSFGTVLGHMSMAENLYRAALRAVEDLPVRVLLTVGPRFDASRLDPVPANVHVEEWVDQARAIREARVVVCHGGSGTAFGALALGVPLVMAPLFADQFENGRRISEAGAGVVVELGRPAGDADRDGVREAHASLIREAVRSLVGSPSHRDRARAVAEEMGAAPDAGEVLGAVARIA